MKECDPQALQRSSKTFISLLPHIIHPRFHNIPHNISATIQDAPLPVLYDCHDHHSLQKFKTLQ